MDYAQQRKTKAMETEEKLLKTAQKLMQQRGYDEVSIRDICNAAGVTTGAFYHHFHSKEDMLKHGGEQLDLYIKQQIEQHPQQTGLEYLQLIFGAYAAYMEQNQGELTARYYQNMLEWSRIHPYNEKRYIYQMVNHFVGRAIEEQMLTKRYSPEIITRYSIRHFRGIVIDWAFHNYGFSLTEAMEEEFLLTYLLFRGRVRPCNSKRPEKEPGDRIPI